MGRAEKERKAKAAAAKAAAAAAGGTAEAPATGSGASSSAGAAVPPPAAEPGRIQLVQDDEVWNKTVQDFKKMGINIQGEGLSEK